MDIHPVPSLSFALLCVGVSPMRIVQNIGSLVVHPGAEHKDPTGMFSVTKAEALRYDESICRIAGLEVLLILD
jgi:hypothetical protein